MLVPTARAGILVGGLMLSLLGYSSSASGQRYTTGDDYDEQAYIQTPKSAPLSRGDFGDVPSGFSLEHFAPPIDSQGQSGSCVGWATGYAAHTIALRVADHASKPRRRASPVMSPSYIFNQIKVSEDCSGGSNIGKAARLVSLEGNLPLSEFPYSDQKCYAQRSATQRIQASKFKIRDYMRLGSVSSNRSLHIATRRALAQSQPVVIGMIIGDGFMRYRGEEPIYKPSASDNALLYELGLSGLARHPDWGGHAMTVVGYDDNYMGGAFRVMNSWGSDWGDAGYFWIRYDDYRNFTRSAVAIVPPAPKIVKKPEVNSSLELMFYDALGQRIKLEKRDGRSHLVNPMHSGELLRFEASTSKAGFLYIIGADDAGKTTILFPNKGASSAFIGTSSTLLMPGPTEDYYSKLDTVAGTDYIVAIFSQKKIDIQALERELATGRGAFVSNINSVLSKRVIHPELRSFSKAGKWEGFTAGTSWIYGIVSIKHIDSPVASSDDVAPKIVLRSPEIMSSDGAGEGVGRVVEMSGDEVVIQGVAQDRSAISTIDVKGAYDLKFSSRGAFTAKLDTADIKIGENVEVAIRATDIADNSSEIKITFVKSVR